MISGIFSDIDFPEVWREGPPQGIFQEFCVREPPVAFEAPFARQQSPTA